MNCVTVTPVFAYAHSLISYGEIYCETAISLDSVFKVKQKLPVAS